MSYNTRRTGGTGRGTPTQVNYHQQPSRTVGNPTTPSRNTGYTTSSNQATYNSASQPAYSTQTGYSTAPPPLPAAQPKPAAPQPQPQPAAPQPQPQPQPQQAAAQPPLPAQPPVQMKPPATPPPIKAEPPTPTDTPKAETTPENGEGPKPFWKKKPFVKVSNKIRKARQNAKLRRILNPKNALTFLNELRPGGVKFVIREEPGWGFVASIDIDGKTYSGHALTVSKAKVKASEQALKHVLLEQLSKSQSATAPADKKTGDKDDNEEEDVDMEEKDESEETKSKKTKVEHPEDDLPWGSLAAFALHKLFAEWQKEGTDAIPHGPPQEKYEDEISEEAYFTRRPTPPEFGYPRRFAPGGPPFNRGRGYAPYPPRGPPPPAFGMARRPLPLPPAATYLQNVTRPALPLSGGISSMMPMKKIPDDANKRHPVMILNQLKPNVIYNESREGQPPHVVFIISVDIEGKEYTGRGKSKKEAKKNAAKAALAPMGIVYEDDN